ncbi:hypothetical protein C2845_PM07G26720 [Panicum miliaceum]|uniref:Uncharacterized protein n=1 Tax=Panicum miliaceum TaxID=4540 RepID=A0A3L6SRR8_PANMI|nr:hypothetical protein C2845_PM07G26720 [Panicum miliaceum]
MAVSCRHPSECCVHSSVVGIGISSSSGKGSPTMMQRGNPSRISSPFTPISSSRTSCLPRRGEML